MSVKRDMLCNRSTSTVPHVIVLKDILNHIVSVCHVENGTKRPFGTVSKQGRTRPATGHQRGSAPLQAIKTITAAWKE